MAIYFQRYSGTEWINESESNSSGTSNHASLTNKELSKAGHTYTASGVGAEAQAVWDWIENRWIDPASYGVVGDVVVKHMLSCTTNVAVNNKLFTSSEALFVAGDVGKTIAIANVGADAGGGLVADLVTTIAGFTSTTVVTLTDAMTTDATVCNLTFGTDDTTAWAKTITAARASGGTILLKPMNSYNGTAWALDTPFLHFKGSGAELLQHTSNANDSDWDTTPGGHRTGKCTIWWSGAVGGTMVDIATAPVSYLAGVEAYLQKHQNVHDIWLEDISFIGSAVRQYNNDAVSSNHVATIIKMESVWACKFERLALTRASTSAIQIDAREQPSALESDTIATWAIGDDANNNFNLFKDIFIDNFWADDGIGINRPQSFADNFSGMATNRFEFIRIRHYDSPGIKLVNSDNNNWQNIYIARNPSGSAIGWEFHGTDEATTNNRTRYETIDELSTGLGGLKVFGTHASPPDSDYYVNGPDHITITNLNLDLSAPLPTIMTEGTCQWTAKGHIKDWSNTIPTDTRSKGQLYAGRRFSAVDNSMVFVYDGTDYLASENFTAITIYVDKTNGTDAVGKGVASGTDAVATIQYAIDKLIPTHVNENVTIILTEEDYASVESTLSLSGKNVASGKTITFQGADPASPTASGTMTSNLTEDAVTYLDWYIEDTGLSMTPSAHLGQVVEFTSGPAVGVTAIVEDNDATKLYLIGMPWGIDGAGDPLTPPVSGNTFDVYTPGTVFPYLSSVGQSNFVIDKITIPQGEELLNATGGVNIIVSAFSFNDASGTSLGIIKTNGAADVGIQYSFIQGNRVVQANSSSLIRTTGIFFYGRNNSDDQVVITQNSTMSVEEGSLFNGRNKTFGVAMLRAFGNAAIQFARASDTGRKNKIYNSAAIGALEEYGGSLISIDYGGVEFNNNGTDYELEGGTFDDINATGTITATGGFVGDLTGSSSKSSVTTSGSNTDYPIVFSDSATGATLYDRPGFTYNPSTDTMCVGDHLNIVSGGTIGTGVSGVGTVAMTITGDDVTFADLVVVGADNLYLAGDQVTATGTELNKLDDGRIDTLVLKASASGSSGSITSGSAATVPYDTKDYDPDTTTLSSNVFTPGAGTWLIEAHVTMQETVSVGRAFIVAGIEANIDGAGYAVVGEQAFGYIRDTSAKKDTVHPEAIVTLDADDLVRVQATNISGGDTIITTSDSGIKFTLLDR